jgi:Tfp pilus assembly protein PilV
MQPALKSANRRPPGTAFTLAEVLIAMTLSVAVMSAVLGSVFMTIRSGYSVDHYTDMEQQSRRALEYFGRDVRMAKAVNFVDQNTIELIIPVDLEGNATTTYLYRYDPANGEFRRTANGVEQSLVTGIETLQLRGYQLTGDDAFDPDAPPTTPFDWQIASRSTTQLELSVSSFRQQSTKIRTAQKIISARFILRNKGTS